MVHSILQISFRNKTFLFVKIVIWNFQQLFHIYFLLPPIEKCCLNVCLNEPKFWSFHKIFDQTDAENFSFLSWKTKTFYSKNNIKYTMCINNSFFGQQKPYFIVTLQVLMALRYSMKDTFSKKSTALCILFFWQVIFAFFVSCA